MSQITIETIKILSKQLKKFINKFGEIMVNQDYYQRFAELKFEDFRKMATDNSLSIYEKIGFPNTYREGKENLIFTDIVNKLDLLQSREKTVLDIGPGCSELPLMLIELCRRNGHKLILIDSAEMLSHLPDEPFIRKIPAYYPKCQALFDEYTQKIDAILAYSVFHYVFVEHNIWDFLDRTLTLLADGGQFLIGDIPNISKRKRFFNSSTGIKFHQEFTRSQTLPEVISNQIEHQKIDDSVIFALIARSRNQGFDAYVLPQRADLPMANRREDILITKS